MKTPILRFLLATIIYFNGLSIYAQNVTINPGGITPLTPRLNYDAITALPDPQVGDMAYDLTFLCLRVYNGSEWLCSYQDPANIVPNMALIATAGGTGAEYATGMAMDTSGNIYMTGYFSGTTAFGNITKKSLGSTDIFIAKYNKKGNILWVKTAGGTSEEHSNAIATDLTGNVYITGYFYGTATFGSDIKTSAGAQDIFIAKCDSSGAFQWVKTIGSNNDDAGNSIAVDNTGNIYTAGYFQGLVSFGGKSGTSAGGRDIFLLKYNNAGAYQWVQTPGGTGTDVANDVCVGNNGDVAITGYFSNTATFGTISKTSAGIGDMFVVKYDATGSQQFLQTGGGSGNDIGVSLAINSFGHIYVTGYFWGTTTFANQSRTSLGGNDIFVAYYETVVNALLWLKTAGGAGDDEGEKIIMKNSNLDIYVSGKFSRVASFDNIHKTSPSSSNIFIAQIDGGGSFEWVQTATASNTAGLAIDNAGNLFVAGYFSNTARFGNARKTSAGSFDIFLLKLQ